MVPEPTIDPVSRTLLLLAVFFLAGCGSKASSWDVHPDGRIGPLQIDVSTERDIRDFAGKPDKVTIERMPGYKGRILEYGCTRRCMTTYSISRATGKLSDYWTASPRFTTERGSHVGMSVGEAARRERSKPHPGCGFPRYIHLLLEDDRLMVLAIWKGRVDSIGYLGRHSIYYDGLC
jgi:hypothetical protein